MVPLVIKEVPKPNPCATLSECISPLSPFSPDHFSYFPGSCFVIGPLPTMNLRKTFHFNKFGDDSSQLRRHFPCTFKLSLQTCGSGVGGACLRPPLRLAAAFSPLINRASANLPQIGLPLPPRAPKFSSHSVRGAFYLLSFLYRIAKEVWRPLLGSFRSILFCQTLC